jgi:mannose-1-phosphate guanylyltransferase/mannose-6-phosphate isomerase
MLQKTLLRVAEYAPPVLVLNCALAERAKTDLAAINVKAEQIILEPVGRNTAPALAAAAIEHPSRLLLVLPSDHWIGRQDVFMHAVEQSAPLAQDGWIISFGIRPTRLETGFGYIRRGPVIKQGIHKIDSFIEKPPRAVARTLVRGGTCDWNSGIFLMSAETAIAELGCFEPALLQGVRVALQKAARAKGITRLDDRFAAVPSLSIDVALMERSDRTLVVPLDMDWDDLGTWPALLRRSFA